MTPCRALLALVLCAWIGQAAWADPTPLASALAPAASPAAKSAAVQIAARGELPRRSDSASVGGVSHPAAKFERPEMARTAADAGKPADTNAPAGHLSRNLLVALQILRQRFQ